jgi:large subunit ribosomal protein L17
MLANMASSLIMHKRITTTLAKAKALRMYVEPLITRSKEDTTHSRRVVFSYLKNKYAVAELFREISPKVADRPGGYTRILKLGHRPGDNADMCIIELVDYNENMLGTKEEAKAKTTRRSRRGRKKSTTGAATEEVTQETVVTEETAVTEETEGKEETKVTAGEETEAAVEEKKEEAPAKEKKKEETVEEKKEEVKAEAKEEPAAGEEKEEEKKEEENKDEEKK